MVFELGSKVFIFGLQQARSLNGSIGTVVPCENPERIGVQLPERVVKVRPDNLPVTIVNDPVKGNYLISNNRYKIDDVIFTERPFVVGPEFNRCSGIEEWKPLIHSLSDEEYEKLCTLSDAVNPRLAMEIETKMKIASFQTPNESPEVLQKAEKLMRIFGVNCFLSQGNERRIYYGTSHINHSCAPNAIREMPKGLWTIKAIGEINPGDEINISYISGGLCFQPTSERIGRLCSSWGFTCTCTLCKAGGENDEGEYLYSDLLQEIHSGRRDKKAMKSKWNELRSWLDKYYPYPYGKFLLADANVGIQGAMLGHY